MLFFSQVPFANLGLWKHSFAKTAKLWVKSQKVKDIDKNTSRLVEGGNQSVRH
jgi:hypothetical protein